MLYISCSVTLHHYLPAAVPYNVTLQRKHRVHLKPNRCRKRVVIHHCHSSRCRSRPGPTLQTHGVGVTPSRTRRVTGRAICSCADASLQTRSASSCSRPRCRGPAGCVTAHRCVREESGYRRAHRGRHVMLRRGPSRASPMRMRRPRIERGGEMVWVGEDGDRRSGRGCRCRSAVLSASVSGAICGRQGYPQRERGRRPRAAHVPAVCHGRPLSPSRAQSVMTH